MTADRMTADEPDEPDRATMADKRLTLDELVGELRSGMTIGIGGWGSRRKPMAAVRAILRSDLTDLTVVVLRRPRRRAAVRGRQGGQGGLRIRHPRLHPHRPPLQGGPPDRGHRGMEIDEGMFYLGLLAASQRLPFLPTRAGLGSDVLRGQPRRCAR